MAFRIGALRKSGIATRISTPRRRTPRTVHPRHWQSGPLRALRWRFV